MCILSKRTVSSQSCQFPQMTTANGSLVLEEPIAQNFSAVTLKPMSLFCFGNQHKHGILESVYLKNTFPWRFLSSNSSCTWAHTPRREVARVYWVAKVLSGPRAEAVKCLLNPLGSGCNFNYPLPQKLAGKIHGNCKNALHLHHECSVSSVTSFLCLKEVTERHEL